MIYFYHYNWITGVGTVVGIAGGTAVGIFAKCLGPVRPIHRCHLLNN